MDVFVGSPSPLGSHLDQISLDQAVVSGTNFAIFSANATAVELCLFVEQGEVRYPMHRSGNVWHCFVSEVGEGTLYGFRVAGEVDESKGALKGALFNPQKLLLDPYAKKIIGKPLARTTEEQAWFAWNDPRDNAHLAPKSVVVAPCKFDWENDRLLRTDWAKTVIYELHVKGFSQRNPQIPEPLRGTFAGLAHPASIQHLKRLGITAVELMPINYHADEIHLQKQGLSNYWGYSVMGNNAVDSRLAYDKADPLTEFKQLVKTLHQNGIEVILDVVYNHTVEGEQKDLMLCQRGIDNPSYYWLDESGNYHNWTGCGNALNLSTPEVCQWVVDSLAFWVKECHVDGFRFDLATTLGRTPDFSATAPFFEQIKNHPDLQGIKWIAEPWDIGSNGYQVGGFPAHFSEWNDQYRSQIREFFLWESGNLSDFARRFAGSDDRFGTHSPRKSINYLASHDGFNLQDLVSYNQKNNHANGEQNRDGDNHNFSHNHGIEGETDNPDIIALRERSARSLLATLFLSNGVPMLLAGDELGHSQQGNNNSYCQDNSTTWIDWQNINADRTAYVASLITLRQKISLLAEQRWWTADDVQWLAPNSEPMQVAQWHDRQTKAIQILLQNQWLILINGKKSPQLFQLPQGKWQQALGQDIVTWTVNPNGCSLGLEQMGIAVFQKHA